MYVLDGIDSQALGLTREFPTADPSISRTNSSVRYIDGAKEADEQSPRTECGWDTFSAEGRNAVPIDGPPSVQGDQTWRDASDYHAV